jgi:hypothetical protein
MDQAPPARPWALAVTATIITTFSVLAWVLISFGAMFNENVDDRWIYSGLLMPGAVLGAMAFARTGRRAYFAAGVLLALVPVVVYVVLAIVTPEPATHWKMD